MTYLRTAHGWQMSTYQLKIAMGCPVGVKGGVDWPAAGIPDPKDIDGTPVYVLPANTEGSKRHRAFAICPDCHKHVPAGRLHQHRKAHR